MCHARMQSISSENDDSDDEKENKWRDSPLSLFLFILLLVKLKAGSFSKRVTLPTGLTKKWVIPLLLANSKRNHLLTEDFSFSLEEFETLHDSVEPDFARSIAMRPIERDEVILVDRHSVLDFVNHWHWVRVDGRSLHVEAISPQEKHRDLIDRGLSKTSPSVSRFESDRRCLPTNPHHSLAQLEENKGKCSIWTKSTSLSPVESIHREHLVR